MRQAGRYLPEYRAIKQRYDFHTLVRTPELATEITLLPVQRFAFDAAIVFSDILVLPEAMGQGYHFLESGGIAMDFVLQTPAQINALRTDSIRERLEHTAQTLRLTRAALGTRTALLGFAGTPWTLATYMLGGAPATLAFADAHAGAFAGLMEKLTTALIDYLQMQIENGADALQLFDSWAALCPDADYYRHSLSWVEYVLAALPRQTPLILFAKGMSHHSRSLAATGAHVLSLDWTRPLSEIRRLAGPDTALQGNLDPALLEESSPENTRNATHAILADMAHHPGHIFNLGHGIRPNAKIENIEIMLDVIRSYERV
jgi:uroporphyrinogen decarboxylase